jgi:hypothetical protein
MELRVVAKTSDRQRGSPDQQAGQVPGAVVTVTPMA